MSLALIAKLLHVFAGIGLIAGLVGRSVVLGRARNVDDVVLVAENARLAGSFDTLVIQSSRLVLVLGVVTAWLQGWPILGFLVGGTSNWVLASLVLFAFIGGLVPTIFLPSGRRFDAALEEAIAQGQVTDRLRVALNDRRTRWAHRVEAVAIVGIVMLMVLKPF